MTALAMIPAGVAAARSPAPPPSMLAYADLLDEWPAFAPLAQVDLCLRVYRLAVLPPAVGAFAAVAFDRPAITGLLSYATSLTDSYGADAYSRPAITDLTAVASIMGQVYAVAPYSRPAIGGLGALASLLDQSYAVAAYSRPPIPRLSAFADIISDSYGA